MPVKVKKKVSSVRLSQRAGAVRSAKTKSSRSTRSLSESRQSSSVVKTKSKVSRASVAPQLNSRTSRTEKKTSRRSVAAQSVGRPSLRMNVYNLKGKVIEKILLPKEIFDAPINNQLMSQAVRVYLANQRQGTVSTKTRGQVKGSSRKIYRQKGTGRARHGSIRAPIFVGGGVVFGPTPRDFSMKLPKKMKRASLFSALSSKLKDSEIKVLSGLEKITPKTKIVFKTLKNLELPAKTKILLVTPDFDLDNVYKAGRNIEGVKILRANMLNTYEVLDNKAILLMKASIEALKKHFLAE